VRQAIAAFEAARGELPVLDLADAA
jgi:hypothetical protein